VAHHDDVEGLSGSQSQRKSCLCDGVYIRGSVEGVSVNFTMDTGASKTVISTKVFDRIETNRRPRLVKSACLRGAGGMPIREKGKAEFTLRLGTLEIFREAVVADVEDDVLLGYDILGGSEKEAADILLSKGKVILDSVEIPCFQIGRKGRTRKVVVADDVKVSGLVGSSVDVYASGVGLTQDAEIGVAERIERLVSVRPTSDTESEEASTESIRRTNVCKSEQNIKSPTLGKATECRDQDRSRVQIERSAKADNEPQRQASARRLLKYRDTFWKDKRSRGRNYSNEPYAEPVFQGTPLDNTWKLELKRGVPAQRPHPEVRAETWVPAQQHGYLEEVDQSVIGDSEIVLLRREEFYRGHCSWIGRTKPLSIGQTPIMVQLNREESGGGHCFLEREYLNP